MKILQPCPGTPLTITDQMGMEASSRDRAGVLTEATAGLCRTSGEQSPQQVPGVSQVAWGTPVSGSGNLAKLWACLVAPSSRFLRALVLKSILSKGHL